VDETVFWIQPLDKDLADRNALKEAPGPTFRADDPDIGPRGSGIDAELVSSFWMWRTGRAAPHEEFSHEVMTLHHPYDQIVYHDAWNTAADID
jgi:hypothetical protein